MIPRSASRAPLGLSLGKKCGRCSTRYCGPESRCSTGRGRARKLCKLVKSGRRRAIQRKQKYSRPSRCGEGRVDDNRGQTCYICTRPCIGKRSEARTGCSCRGTAGSRTCRAWRSRRILSYGGGQFKLEVKMRGWRGGACSLCEQQPTALPPALGWACWKTHWAAERRGSRGDVLGFGLSRRRHTTRCRERGRVIYVMYTWRFRKQHDHRGRAPCDRFARR